MRALRRCERLVTEGLLSLSVGLLLLILVLYITEIVLRYGFSAPTTWSADVIVYVLPAFVFFALPEITRRGTHVAITFLLESLSPPAAVLFNRLISGFCGGLSLVAAWISGTVVARQIDSGLLTDGVTQIPKWLVTAPVTVGLALMGLMFLRAAFDRHAMDAD